MYRNYEVRRTAVQEHSKEEKRAFRDSVDSSRQTMTENDNCSKHHELNSKKLFSAYFFQLFEMGHH